MNPHERMLYNTQCMILRKLFECFLLESMDLFALVRRSNRTSSHPQRSSRSPKWSTTRDLIEAHPWQWRMLFLCLRYSTSRCTFPSHKSVGRHQGRISWSSCCSKSGRFPLEFRSSKNLKVRWQYHMPNLFLHQSMRLCSLYNRKFFHSPARIYLKYQCILILSLDHHQDQSPCKIGSCGTLSAYQTQTTRWDSCQSRRLLGKHPDLFRLCSPTRHMEHPYSTHRWCKCRS